MAASKSQHCIQKMHGKAKQYRQDCNSVTSLRSITSGGGLGSAILPPRSISMFNEDISNPYNACATTYG